MPTVINIAPLISILVSSGLIGYVVRLVIKIEVLKTLFEQQQIDSATLQEDYHKLDVRTTTLENTMKELRDSLNSVQNCVKDIPKILEKTTFIEREVNKFMPEKEINLMHNSNERRISTLETEVKMQRAEHTLLKRPTPEF